VEEKDETAKYKIFSFTRVILTRPHLPAINGFTCCGCKVWMGSPVARPTHC